MYNNISPKKANNDINVIIEISANSAPIKYEIDKDSGLLVVDRFIKVAMQYPCNYGFIPNTLSGDGDPVDVLIITDDPLIPGCLIVCKVVGVLMMTDESGVDEKIIAVPCNKTDPTYANVNDIVDVAQGLLNKIRHFFEHYKDLESGKWVKIERFDNRVIALGLIDEGIKRAVSNSAMIK